MKRFLRYCVLLFTAFLSVSSISAQAVDGKFYSMVYYGGSYPYYNSGTINMFDPLTNYDTAVVNLAQPTGWRPYGNFIQLSDGMLYGMTPYGGNGGYPGNGVIFRYNVLNGQDTILYSLPGNGDSGFWGYGTLCHATNDSLYGLTYAGPASTFNQGVLFSFNYHTCKYKVLSVLRARLVGSEPAGGLIQATNGLLYGLTTNDTLPGNTGTIFSYNPVTGAMTELHIFQGQPDGYYPRGNLLQVNDSMLYGLTENGGVNNLGCVFSYNIHSNTEQVVYSFAGGTDGEVPEESLMKASDGYLYGTTYLGGSSNLGTLFKFNLANNTETVVHNFAGGTAGAYPYADVIQANDGLLYGSTNIGGAHDSGVIFSYNISTQVETALKSYVDTLGTLPYADFLEVMSATVTGVNNVCANNTNGSLTLHVRGGKPAFTYQWSTGATTSSISGLVSGIYTCSVTDSRGISFKFTDTVLPLPTNITFNVSNACSGDSNGIAIADISGGTLPFTYSWTNGNTTDTASGLQQGTYTCSLVDAHGCTASASVTITQAAPLVISSTSTPILYPANYGTITVTASGGIPPGDVPCYHYLWSNGAPDSSVIDVYDSGTYAVCVTSCYGCGSLCDSNIIVVTSTKNIFNSSNSVNVYPVPGNGLITVVLNGTGFESLEITDELGREIYTQLLSPLLKNNTQKINLTALSEGIYVLRAKSHSGVAIRKIIIQK